MLVGLIVLLGIGLVFAARSSRDPIVSPRTGEHWHSAYEVYDCGTARPAILNETDPDGIHTHADGLIHIHPFNSSATGTDAKLGVFFSASGLNVTENSIESGEWETIDNTTGCGDEESAIKIARWNVDGADGVELVTVYTSDFDDIRLLQEREAFTIAKLPLDEDPPPPSESTLAQLDASTGTTNIATEPVTDDTIPTDDTAPDDTIPTDDTAPDDTTPDDTTPDDTAAPTTTSGG